MKRYLSRAGKYSLQLLVLFVLIFSVMNIFETRKISLEMLLNKQGWILAGGLIFFSLLYPFFGFAKRTLTFDASNRSADVDRVMEMCGFKRVESTPNTMVYRAATPVKRFMLLYEDKITIQTIDGLSVMEGVRKEVFKASYRMSTFIS